MNITGLVACLVLCFLLGAFVSSDVRISTPDVIGDDVDDDDDVDPDDAADVVEGLSAVERDETFKEESSDAIPSSCRD